jgi:dTDP-4-amino-4,6-dideoxygalactose transaminase
MRIGRTLPPTAAPLGWRDLINGLAGLAAPARTLRAREEELRRHFGARHLFLVSSGKAALTLALTALRSRSPRTDVVIPAYTCFSVPAAVLKAGLRPVLCDIDPTTFDFDERLLEQTIGPATLAVVAHHLFGVPADVERLRRLCHARGIAVVEDAAQAMGVERFGRPLGTMGDVGVFSLGRGKNITCGSGGVVFTKSDWIAEGLALEYRRLEQPSLASTVVDLLQSLAMAAFIRPRLYWVPASLPFLRLGETIFPATIPVNRLSGMKAGLLRDWRSHLAASNRVRATAAADYSVRLSQPLPAGCRHPYLRLPLLVATRSQKERLAEHSRKHGLGLGMGYPTALDEVPELRVWLDGRHFPAAKHVASHLVTLPTHEWLSASDRRAIAAALQAIAGDSRPSAEWPKAS